MMQENERLRRSLQRATDKLASTHALSESRAEYIRFESAQQARLLDNAVLQGQHLAKRAQTEHEHAVRAQEGYEGAEAAARHYAESAWQSHQHAERHAEQSVRVGHAAFLRVQEAGVDAYQWSTKVRLLESTMEDISTRDAARAVHLTESQLECQQASAQAVNIAEQAQAANACLALHEQEAASAQVDHSRLLNAAESLQREAGQYESFAWTQRQECDALRAELLTCKASEYAEVSALRTSEAFVCDQHKLKAQGLHQELNVIRSRPPLPMATAEPSDSLSKAEFDKFREATTELITSLRSKLDSVVQELDVRTGEFKSEKNLVAYLRGELIEQDKTIDELQDAIQSQSPDEPAEPAPQAPPKDRVESAIDELKRLAESSSAPAATTPPETTGASSATAPKAAAPEVPKQPTAESTTQGTAADVASKVDPTPSQGFSAHGAGGPAAVGSRNRELSPGGQSQATGYDVRSFAGDSTLDENSKSEGKEAPQVKIPSRWPNITQLREWKAAICRGLVAASKWYDKAEVAWFLETDKDTATFEGLAICLARFANLDQKLSVALIKIEGMPKQLRTRITRKENDAILLMTTLTGRQIAFLILEWFRNDEDHLGVVYSFNDLNEIQWLGDDRMDEFVYNWDSIQTNFEGWDSMPAKVFRDMFHKRWETSKVLKGDVEYYNRLDNNHPDRSMDFMRGSIERYMRRVRTQKNRDAQLKAYTKGVPTQSPEAAAATTQPKAKGKAKGKQTPKPPPKARSPSADKSGGGNRVLPKDKAFKDCTEKDFCWHFQKGACPRENCNFKHSKAPKEILEKMKEPQARSASPGGRRRGRSQSRGGGGGGGGASGPKKFVKHCAQFLRTGACDKNPCKPHLNRAQYDAESAKLNS